MSSNVSNPVPTPGDPALTKENDPQRSGLKMKIKRNNNLGGTANSFGTTLKNAMSRSSTSSSASSSAHNSRPASPSTTAEDKEGMPHFLLAAAAAAAAAANISAQNRDAAGDPREPPAKKLKINGTLNGTDEPSEESSKLLNNGCDENQEQNINEVATMTEPDNLGPCEPGTAVKLQGIVWQETERGLLVLNVTWKGKTYMGTLLDCNRQSEAHKWGPPSDPNAVKGRGGKRNRGARSRTPPVKGSKNGSKKKHKNGFTVPVSPLAKDSKNGGKSKRKAALNALSGLKEKNHEDDGGDSDDDDDDDGFDDDEGDPRDRLIECPKGNCSKKFRDLEALKFHLSFAHNDLKKPKEKLKQTFQKPPKPENNVSEEPSEKPSLEKTSFSDKENEAKEKENPNSQPSTSTSEPLDLASSSHESRLNNNNNNGFAEETRSRVSPAYSDISDEESDQSKTAGVVDLTTARTSDNDRKPPNPLASCSAMASTSKKKDEIKAEPAPLSQFPFFPPSFNPRFARPPIANNPFLPPAVNSFNPRGLPPPGNAMAAMAFDASLRAAFTSMTAQRPPPPNSKALDILQQHANQYLASNKLQELQEKAFNGQPGSLPTPAGLLPHHFPRLTPRSPLVGSPPVLRHEHSHTHLHLPGFSSPTLPSSQADTPSSPSFSGLSANVSPPRLPFPSHHTK